MMQSQMLTLVAAPLLLGLWLRRGRRLRRFVDTGLSTLYNLMRRIWR